MEQNRRDNAYTDEEGCRDTRAGCTTDVVEHRWEPDNRFSKTMDRRSVDTRVCWVCLLPEWTDKAPDLTDERHEDTDTGRFLRMAIDSVGDQDSCNDLIAERSNCDANERGYLPVALPRQFIADQKHNDSDYNQEKTTVEPEPEFRFRSRMYSSRTPIHPMI